MNAADTSSGFPESSISIVFVATPFDSLKGLNVEMIVSSAGLCLLVGRDRSREREHYPAGAISVLSYLAKAELITGADRTAAGKVDLQQLFGLDVAPLFILQRGDDFPTRDVDDLTA